ncbi:molybdopterin-guanine dinucleotide biosynthesis protein A [Planococcus glaciei]|uniref:molybdenum cofactor guanylyltransferase n=1 Tax=Planococcus glaciei TaxID=459472 RepID=UPI000887FAE5|nr:molybdenum cofactor guanylyltransferase [Planococcus glaciei]SDI08505.1 molybdopterin-guanine dinucleotide biosynthesis protein A [Planococcus glaciei]
MSRTVGILLAGGLSRRFGSPKAFAEIDGRLFYERVYEALAAACGQVVIVTRPELITCFPAELDVIADLPKVAGKGPLAGICSAMEGRPAERYLVLPCDMPFIGPNETQALVQLSSNADVTAVQTAVEKIPLFSVWNGNWSQELKKFIEFGNLSVFAFLETIHTEWISSSLIHEDLDVFQNINTRIN